MNPKLKKFITYFFLNTLLYGILMSLMERFENIWRIVITSVVFGLGMAAFQTFYGKNKIDKQ